MRARPFYWIDAFTDQRLGGNPCAVVFDADDLSEAQRIAYTRETRLSECAFVQTPDPARVDPSLGPADVAVRYYLASREIKMAGHPTIATVTALMAQERAHGRAAAAIDKLVLEVGAGPLAVSVQSDPADPHAPPWISMRFRTFHFGEEHAPETIARVSGLAAADIVGRPQTVSVGGGRFAVTLLRDADAMRRAALDVSALRAAQAAGADFDEPYFVILEGATERGDTFSRLLLAPPEPPEDPYTGSAAACLGAYLHRHGLGPAARLCVQSGAPFIAEQGHWMERPGSARVTIETTGGGAALDSVVVAGQGVVLMRGEVLL